MLLNKRIAHNTIIHLAGKFISLILSLVAVAVMTRYLGKEGFGYYITVTAFLQLFGILADFGLTLTTVQMISRPGIDFSRVMNSIMSFRIITAVGFLALAPILIWFFPYNIFIKLGVLITVAAFFSITIIQTLTGVFQQKLKMFKLTLAEVLGKIVFVGLVVLVAWLGKDIYWIFGAITVGNILNLVIVFLYSREHIKWQWQVDLDIWKDLIKRAWPIALSISFNLIYLRMDIIILSLFRSQTEVGLYGATYRVVDILTMLPAVFMGIILPIAAMYFAEKNYGELKNILQKSFDALIIFAMPIMAGTMIIAGKVMVFVAGGDFALSGEILKVLILASGMIFATSLFAYAIVAIDKQKSMVWGYLTTAVITLAGYFIFIPKYGYWGAAWMTVFSELLILGWTAILIYRAIKFFPSLKTFAKTIPAAMIMAGVIYFLRSWHVVILLAIAVVVYFSFLYLFGGIKKQTLQELVRFK